MALSIKLNSVTKIYGDLVQSQSRSGIVHFVDAFLIAKYIILSITSSFGNDALFFVTFRRWKLRDSMALVV